MASSRFSSPFFKKSPLHGAYTSGVDGMVTVSYADIHKDFQKGVSDNANTARAIYDEGKTNNCSLLDQRLATDKLGKDAYAISKKNCANQEKENYLNSPEGQKALRDQEISEIGEAAAKQASETLQGYSGKFDMMKSWGIAKKQKEEEAKKSMNTYFSNKEEEQEYRNQKK
tara:strand:+ start:639 stop:1151 length:513 start_codon:yes stop_codon:yes gene_type:complete